MKCEKLQRVLQFIILSNFPGSALSHEGNTERQRMMRRERERKKKGNESLEIFKQVHEVAATSRVSV